MRAIIKTRLKGRRILLIVKFMTAKRFSKNRLVGAIFGVIFGVIGVMGGMNLVPTAYAEPVNSGEGVIESVERTTEENTTENPEEEIDVTNELVKETRMSGMSCQSSLGAIGWLVCPTTGKIAEAVDWLYEKIENVLVVNPVEMKDGSPIYEIWKYMLGVTNIVFIIFFLVMVYSQITGMGITNYGLKKTLPKLIVAAVLVNLSFLICSLAVDASNIIGEGLRGVFTTIENTTMGDMALTGGVKVSEMYSSLAGGSVLALGAGVIAFETGAIWMLIPTVLGAIVAVVIGLVTIAMRQAVVALLIMVSPLAIVAYMLPNTEQWFKKWRQLLIKMLIFYPMFSLLFGASQLAGFAIITSASDGFGILLGTAVQIFPLFFSVNLMKMSGTVLGTINSKLNGLMARPLAANRSWAESRRAQTSAYHAQYGVTPSAHLRRYLENRKALRESTTEKLRTMRKNEANIYEQKKISNGYDGSEATSTEGNLKPNKYTRIAKDLSNLNLASETATMDTKHVLNEYGSYFVNEKFRKLEERKGISAEERKKLEAAKSKDAESLRAAVAARNFLEYGRAKMTTESDSESDTNFMIKTYLDAKDNYSPNGTDKERFNYEHYVKSSAGGLGSVGETRVLGKILEQAQAVENKQRRDINIIATKYPHAKTAFRNMFVGYLVNDDGFAVNSAGKEIETERGYLYKNDPSRLVIWDKVDENGPYYDWYDTNGKYVTRIYKKDKPAIKELFSNFDAPINDPINNLYGMLAGVKEGDIKVGDNEKENAKYKYIGLDGIRTTIGRGILGAQFKEKNAAFSPMVAEMISKGYVKDPSTMYLAYLDSLNKATKPGAFNMQDTDAIKMFARIMDAKNWDEIFAKDKVKDFKNVNGKPLIGLHEKLNPKTNKMETEEVPFEKATEEEVRRYILKKFVNPAAHKIAMMMSRQTQNTADNQKAGTIVEWGKLYDVMKDLKTKANDKDNPMPWLEDPFEQSGDMRSMAYEITGEMYTIDKETGKKVSLQDKRRRSLANSKRRFSPQEHLSRLEEMYINNISDPYAFARDIVEYCDGFPELKGAKDDIEKFIDDELSQGRGTTVEDLKFRLENYINTFLDRD